MPGVQLVQSLLPLLLLLASSSGQAPPPRALQDREGPRCRSHMELCALGAVFAESGRRGCPWQPPSLGLWGPREAGGPWGAQGPWT